MNLIGELRKSEPGLALLSTATVIGLLFTLILQTAGADRPDPVSPVMSIDAQAPIAQQMEQTFSLLDSNHVPTGVLLEKGAILYRDLIRAKNGSDNQRQSMDYYAYLNALGALKRSVLFDNGDILPDISDLESLHKGRQNRLSTQSDGIPLALAIVEYNSIAVEGLGKENFDGGVFLPDGDEPVGARHIFVGSTLLAPVVYGSTPTLVLDSRSLINSSGGLISDIVFSLDGKSYRLTRDQPFKIALPKNRKTTNTDYRLQFKLDGVMHETRGRFAYLNVNSATPDDGTARAPNPASSSSCYDLPAITADLPFNGKQGKLNMRIYPSSGSVEGSSVNTVGCYIGSRPQLNQVMLIVDGFDVANDRTHESIYQDFGESMEQFIAQGFDLVVLDYEVGNDFIQRNGLAIRKLLTRIIPQWLADGADERIVVMSGSMGTQTSRYAMRTAELAGETHNVALFFALDGPFRGANIPIGMQAMVEFFAMLGIAESRVLLNGLNSPAAGQQLIKNRFGQRHGPFAGISTEWYLPRAEFYDYYNEVNQLGLPQQSRNVGIASGSGTGTLFSPFGLVFPPYTLNYASLSSLIFSGTVDAKTDHSGRVFHGYLRFLLSKLRVTLTLRNGRQWDVAPGGFRESPREITDLFNAAGLPITMISPLKWHSFVPTFSALDINTPGPNYVPANDANFLVATPFDAVWYEKCNKKHVAATRGSLAVIGAELQAFLAGSTVFPPQAELALKPCGVREGEPEGPPSVPANFRIQSYAGGIAILVWDHVLYADTAYYEIYASDRFGGNYAYSANSNSNSHTVYIRRPTYYKIRACNSFGCGGFTRARLADYASCGGDVACP